MMLLFWMFLLMLVVVFSLVVIMTRPTTEQTAVERRIGAVLLSEARLGGAGSRFDTQLVIAEQQSLDWLEKAFAKTRLIRSLQSLTLQSQASISPGTTVILVAGLSISVFTGTYLLTSMLWVAIMAALLAGYLPIGYLRLRRSRRITAFNASLPDCIET